MAGSGPAQGSPYRPAPGPGQTGPQQPPRRQQPPHASPAPLSGPAAGIGGLATGDGNAYSQTADPADRRHDNYDDYSATDRVEDHESGAEMTPAPTSRANKTNTLSVVALILSVIGVTFIIGIVCGHVARSQIRRTGEQGDAFAIAALWVGYLYLAATVLVLGGYFYIVGSGS
ncbi:DUF4190 domain-containing protein [Nocardia sp. 348MFTsu5.1]|uniref:DUF4190 domain-containing protein n=1 Tax=Nocardia sp. 348MFTsu5.1 TaxID=1172185 RepID=UPI00036A3F8F|nr:DUF4190 domain-containing protein [Nocardia sp. 348MFTsu5.1]